MKILVLHNRYRQLGGEDVSAAREVSMLRAHGEDVTEYQCDNEAQGAAANLVLLARSSWSDQSYETVSRLCREFRPDIVHVHNFWMRLTPAVHAAARSAGAATVQTLHNYRLVCANALLLRDGQVCEDCLGGTAWRGVWRSCYHGSAIASAAAVRMARRHAHTGTWQRDVDAFIAPSESARARLRHAVPADRLFVKPNFVEDPGLAGRPPSASRRILFAGRLAPEKGAHLLLAAWAGLAPETRASAQLTIVGDGPERASLEAQARSLAIEVTFAGRLSPAEWLRAICGARAVVVPSVCLETFGAAAVEAFAYGRPAVVSGMGALGELVQNGSNGLRFDPAITESCSAAIESILNSNDLADRLGAHARTTYQARFTPEANFLMLRAIYERAAARRAAQAGYRVVPAMRADTLAAAPSKALTEAPGDALTVTAACEQPARTPPPPKTEVVGVGLTRSNYGELLRLCRAWITQGQSRWFAVLSVHPVMLAFFDREYREILNRASVATTDGMPLVWALRSLGVKDKRRVYGPNLMLALCGQAQREGHRIFLYGGREETLPVLCERLRARFPGLQIAGSWSPPFRPLTPEEDAAAVARIRTSGADIVFCGIGSPKQERWMESHVDRLPGCLLFGVGAAFDFHAGRVRQAPPWMQRSGLEWLFRLSSEPGRLWQRYVLVNPLFLVLWALQWLRSWGGSVRASLMSGRSLPKRLKGWELQ